MSIDLIHGRIEMAHGSGGRASSQLIDALFLPAFLNPVLKEQNDYGHFNVNAGQMVVATDSHVISPLFFPGGDIGSLSVYGTVNDVAMSGAKPTHLTAGFILEEGFPLADLKKIVDSIATAAKRCHVEIITGDTKVVEKGKGDGMFINTTGIGWRQPGIHFSPQSIQPGDKILLSGSIGDHGVAVLSKRQQLPFTGNLLSDSQPLHELVAQMLPFAEHLRYMRDPTRGGLAAILNELCQSAQCGMTIHEQAIPISETVAAVTELLGLDPLHIANEGKLVAICAPQAAEDLLAVMRQHPVATQAMIIGEVTQDEHCLVQLNTQFGGNRMIDWKYAEPLPRIC